MFEKKHNKLWLEVVDEEDFLLSRLSIGKNLEHDALELEKRNVVSFSINEFEGFLNK